QIKVPTNPADVTSEITSFAEYAAASKFKASYLKHLNGGLDTPIRPGDPRSRGGNHGRNGRDGGGNGNGSGSGGRGNNHDNDGLTHEQRETNRQLQQHLRQHNFPTNQLQGVGGSSNRRSLNPLRRPPSEAGGNNQGNNNNNNPGVRGGEGGGGRNNNNNNNNNVPLRQIQQQLGARHRPHHRTNPSNNNNNNTTTTNSSNPAVSTISISFSPDSRTVASTHGDHTVKITCCHTGKLLRQLEGHPRTPWTVKYHPTNPRIVASGCLGFQVRVWDWNFQKEGVRKERRLGRERRWGGRYADLNDDRRGGGGRNGVGGLDGYAGGGMNNMASSGSLDDNSDYYGSSPRGVVEKNRRGWDNEDVDDMGADCTNATNAGRSNPWGLPTSASNNDDETDDYATHALLAAGIPPDDPAWYDTESEAYNYEDGIGVCLNMIRLHSAVISLSFHPSGEILAMASGSTLHLWDYNQEKRKRKKKVADGATNILTLKPLSASSVRESDARILNRSENSDFPRGQTMDFRHDSALRCVHFPPAGDILIVGGVNPPSHNEGLPNSRGNNTDPRSRVGRGGMSGGGMSFHLRMWGFDLDAVL
ncbi:hypothetical protein ACHAXR_004625, partial [Thalassiosira sp. AJA248-18]